MGVSTLTVESKSGRSPPDRCDQRHGGRAADRRSSTQARTVTMDEKSSSGSSGRADAARKALRAAAREAVPPFTAQWSAVLHGGAEAMDVNAALPLIGAWSTFDMPHAAGLLRSTLEASGSDGRLDRFISPADPSASGPPAWPLLAVAARRISTKVLEAERDDVLELLRLYLGWAVRYFDPEGRAQPRWPDAESAFISDAWDRELLPVDLAAFLSAEFKAFDELQAALGLEVGDDPRVPTGYREVLSRHIRHYLWDPEALRFTDRYATGARIARLTLSAATPLFIVDSLPRVQVEAARRFVAASSPLLGDHGLMRWERWPDDPEPPPQPALQQAVVFEALMRPTLRSERESLGRRVAAASPPGAADEPVHAALSLRVALADKARNTDPDYPAWVRWLDQRTRLILWSFGAVILLVSVFLLTVPRFFPRSGEGPSIEALAGLARSHYERGEYEQAGNLYAGILAQSNLPAIAYQLGNTRYRQERYAEAEELYRRAMTHSDFGVRAQFNLAQVLIQKGNTPEAIALLNAIVDDYGHTHPEVAQRAAAALGFLESEE